MKIKNISEKNNKQLKIMSENLKTLRKAKNWTIEELSEISKIDKKILIQIENCEDFELWYLIHLCRIYETPVSKIFLQKNKLK